MREAGNNENTISLKKGDIFDAARKSTDRTLAFFNKEHYRSDATDMAVMTHQIWSTSNIGSESVSHIPDSIQIPEISTNKIFIGKLVGMSKIVAFLRAPTWRIQAHHASLYSDACPMNVQLAW